MPRSVGAPLAILTAIVSIGSGLFLLYAALTNSPPPLGED